MKAKTTFKILGFILVTAVILFGGIGLTGVAAQSAIPGDALYPVKTTIENTRLSLAQDAGDRAQMKLAFAEQRLSEITGLVREGRYREIREAVLAFEANINAAIIELETVSAVDPARAAAITQEVTSALTRYAQTLSELAAVAPDSVKPEVTRAFDTTQIASGLGQINGNENANANDNSSINDNVNTNTNDNANGNTNENGDDNNNANLNGDDNSNSNSNDNGDDDNSNSNSNSNANDNDDDGNANANDNSTVDDNSNGGMDDNGNSNDNGDDDNSNSNDNDDDGNDDNSGQDRGSDDDDYADDDDNSGKGSGKDD